MTPERKALLAYKKATAAEILEQINELEQWRTLVQDDNPGIRLEAMKYLTDRRDGKAPQTVNYNDITDHSPERLSELLSSAVTRTHQPIGQA